MHFNVACITTCVFAVAALAVPVEVERKVVVVRAEVCPAPAPAPATTAPEVSPSPPTAEYHSPPPVTAPAPPTATVSNPPPAPQTTSVDNKQCAAGTTVHCCDTVDSTDNSNVLNQLNAAGIDSHDAEQKGQVGLTCTPITTSLIDALNGNVCQGAVTACCENTNQVGLVNLNLGCTIIPVNL
ncbi:fruiting body protein SC3 precursor, putative [Talaromyces stipitatus ATCC 10500]|uniref:Hydrophobin n=1 Tax=Talaromyces stipitatus (strain ATCC 10500 / CBS 375.48 / QM 6759 / NRRL 1006) TaxID=441959 RepID=B8MPD8_TALSN|nr:fruiting body protein SC3 precursor, putative [Talaromyces stipitatus ATCC 10500]EED14377.1 fruiting body protein SC3 precursor, putative [Talaromyces stipitatus ATCC 10500]